MATSEPGRGPRPPAGHLAASLSWPGDFSRLWVGQAVSAFGGQVTVLALPLTAVAYLHATAFQIGLLNGAGELAFLGPMLVFGVLVDRVRRRPLMIGADLARAALIGAVPVLAWAHSLGIGTLYLVALTTGALTSVFSLAYRAYLPSILDAEVLLAGNRRLQATDSVSDVAGPGLAGIAIQLLRAPFALALDAGSFLVSAGMVASIRTTEPVLTLEVLATPGTSGTRRDRWHGVLHDIGSGVSFTFRHPILRPLAAADATFNFFAQLMLTLFVLYAVRDARLSSSQIGVVYAAFGLGGLAAAAALGRLVTRLGYGRLLIGGYLTGALAIAATPFINGPALVATAGYGVAFFVAGCGVVTLNIAEMTLRQIAAPPSMQGRVAAGFGCSSARSSRCPPWWRVCWAAGWGCGPRCSSRPAAFRCPRCGWCSRRSPRCGRNRRYVRPPRPSRRPPVRPAPGRMTAPPGSLRCRAPYPARAHRLPQLCGG